MKNVMKIFVAVSCVLFVVTGCSSNDQGIIIRTCTLTTADEKNGYAISSTYKIEAKNGVVLVVTSTEMATSDDKDVLDYFEKNTALTYKNASETYGGYSYTIEREDKSVTTIAIIDYTKMDMQKYVNDYSSMKKYVNNSNKLTLDGALDLYKSYGAICG